MPANNGASLATPTTGRRRRRRAGSNSRFGVLMATPYIVGLLAFGIGPTAYALYLSMVSDYDGAFLGFWNWSQVFVDYRFSTSVMNVTKFVLIWIPFMFVVTIVISLMLQARPGRFTNTMKLVYYLPGAFTGAAAALLWIFIMNPSAGPFGPVLRLFGWEYANQVVTTDGLPLIYALMAFTSGVGGWVIIMFGALNGISTDVLESASLDGANRWQLALQIQLPLLSKYLVYMGIVTFTAALQIYAEPQLLNSYFGVGATATTPASTWSINQLILTLGIQEGKIGEASALSLLVLLVAVIAGWFLVFRTDFFDSKEVGK